VLETSILESIEDRLFQEEITETRSIDTGIGTPVSEERVWS
jgi:hypothetical protein